MQFLKKISCGHEFRIGARFLGAALAVSVLSACATAGPPERNLDAFIRNAAEAAEAEGKHAAAAAHYQSLRESAPQDPAILTALARNLRKAGRPEDAIDLLTRSPDGLRDHPILLVELAKQHLAEGDAGLALERSDDARAALPSHWEAAHVRALALDRLGRHDEAQRSYEQALSLSPGNAEVMNNMALSLALEGELDAAIRLLESAAAQGADGRIGRNLSILKQLRAER